MSQRVSVPTPASHVLDCIGVANLTLVLALKVLHFGISLVLSKSGQLVLLAVAAQQCAFFALMFLWFSEGSALLSTPLASHLEFPPVTSFERANVLGDWE